MKTFRLDIVSRDGLTALDDAVFLNAPGQDGWLTVEAGHEPLVCALAAGPLHVRRASGAQHSQALEGGVMSVRGDAVTIVVGRRG